MKTASALIGRAELVFSFAKRLAVESAGRTKGARTRAQIQIAACRVLDGTDPRDLTIALICQEAGISNGTFYIYFSDRAVLIDALLMEFVEFLQSSMRAASTDQPDDTSRAATGAYFEMFRQNRGLMRCLIHHQDSFPEAQTAFHQLNRDWVGAVVESAERQMLRNGQGGAISKQELQRRAYALGGMVDQYLCGLLLSNDPHLAAVSEDREAVLDTLALIWKRGMAI